MCEKGLQKGTTCGKVSLSNVKKIMEMEEKKDGKCVHKLPMEKVLAE